MLRTLCRRRSSTLAKTPLRLQQEQDERDLQAVLPKVIDEIKEVSKTCNIPSETEWLGKLLAYTVPGGKMVRPKATFNAMRLLAPPGKAQDEEYMYHAKCLAWSIEMMQALFLTMDDIADRAPMRRKRACWHTLVGPAAVFDGLLLEHCVYQLAQRHLTKHAYERVLDLLHRTIFQMVFGENKDLHSESVEGEGFDEFSIERFRALTRFKTGQYTYYTPTAAAMLACGIEDPATHKAALNIGFDLGYVYQVQDDYLDVYGVIEDMGKQRTDIKNGKCTWLIVEAKRRASPEQLKALKKNYGFNDDAKVAKVVKIFNELNMREVCLEHEEKVFQYIEGKIDKYSKVLPPDLYTYVLESIKYHVNR
ncbi:Farnesyl pyrophosphate synthase [Frankliniella fusca]|uniref:Farnesyl pyrophosphate synthase n=1 Tax=Frankliniella fusca TaxID=407009 RepID=A0AAE1HWK0_9NEOP|nr:Farnesyl pyrophosphate synthase [Frankliniella fusca]